jgi:hypothetical protein
MRGRSPHILRVGAASGSFALDVADRGDKRLVFGGIRQIGQNLAMPMPPFGMTFVWTSLGTDMAEGAA